MTETQSFNVSGMSCEHCVAAVGGKVGELEGVEHVEVDLGSGTVTVLGSELDAAAIRAAVQDAGYALAE